jgi:ribosomal RNA-processing protein 8
VRSRFAAGGGSGSSGEDFRPFLSCLQQLGFKLVKQDASNRMFVVFVLKKQQQAAAGAAAALKWPPLKACVYKKR